MKILALEREVPGVPVASLEPHPAAEAARAWQLHQEGVIREIYFRADRTDAVLILECASQAEAKAVLSTLPLVRRGLIDFELVPLVPYGGFARLFGTGQDMS